MNTNTETIELVKAALKHADRSSNWVALKSGINSSTLRRRLLGGGDFTVNELARIAKALGIKPSELVPEEFKVAA